MEGVCTNSLTQCACVCVRACVRACVRVEYCPTYINLFVTIGWSWADMVTSATCLGERSPDAIMCLTCNHVMVQHHTWPLWPAYLLPHIIVQGAVRHQLSWAHVVTSAICLDMSCEATVVPATFQEVP